MTYVVSYGADAREWSRPETIEAAEDEAARITDQTRLDEDRAALAGMRLSAMDEAQVWPADVYDDDRTSAGQQPPLSVWRSGARA